MVRTLHVDDFGAKSLRLGEDIPSDAVAFRNANTAAIQAALDTAFNNGGGVIEFGAGVYHTSGTVGFDLDFDANVGIVFRGCGSFPTMIWCRADDVPCFQLHCTSSSEGNIRSVIMENFALRGGRHSLSLYRAAYNQFNSVWFWVSNEWSIQSVIGQRNQFNNCSFAESGANDGDAALFVSSYYEELNNCTFGENCGGVVQHSGRVNISGGTAQGAWYRGNRGYRWNTGAAIDLGLEHCTPAMISTIGGYTGVHAMSVSLGQTFVLAKSAYGLVMNGCQVFSGASPSTPPGSSPGFHGFVDVVSNPASRIALVVTGNLFHISANESGADSGFVLTEKGPFTGCVFANNVLTHQAEATMHLLEDTAPSLYEPGNGNIATNAVRVSL